MWGLSMQRHSEEMDGFVRYVVQLCKVPVTEGMVYAFARAYFLATSVEALQSVSGEMLFVSVPAGVLLRMSGLCVVL